jgi:membrane protease YdiL (CAAX protease family)
VTSPSLPSQPPPRPPEHHQEGWYLAADTTWRRTATPPGPGWWLASDERWYPPDAAASTDFQPAALDPDGPDAWRASRWGFGEFGWGMLVYLAGSMLFGVALIAIMIVNGDFDPETGDTDDIQFGVWAISAALIVNYLAFIGVPYLATRVKGLRSLARDFGLSFRWIDLPIGVGGGIVALIGGGLLGTAIDSALGADEATSNIPVDSVNGWIEFGVFLLGVGILTPLAEELFFRGLFLRAGLKRGWSVAVTVAATTAIFTLPHLASVPEWPGVITLTAVIAFFGLVLALLTIWTKLRLGAAIIAHLLINSVGVVVEFWPG